MKLKMLGLVAVAGIALAGCFPPAPPSPPADTFTPGLWRTPGVDGSAPTCSWSRNDKTGNPIGEGWGRAGPQYAQIEPASAGDAAFVTKGCQTWVRVTPPAFAPPIDSVVGDGTYVVGSEMAPGTWSTVAPSAPYPKCHWQRLSGFRGEAADIIQEGGNVGNVTVLPTDAGFHATDCNITRTG